MPCQGVTSLGWFAFGVPSQTPHYLAMHSSHPSALNHLIFLHPISLICALQLPQPAERSLFLQDSGFHCWSAHSKAKRVFGNLHPHLTPFITYSPSLVVPSGKTQISSSSSRTWKECFYPFKSSLLEACQTSPQLFLIADHPETHYSYWHVGDIQWMPVKQMSMCTGRKCLGEHRF